jgi:hypothetical protein
MIDEGDCGAIGGMKIGRGNRSTRRKPAPAPLCLPQIPHDQIQARTQAAAVGTIYKFNYKTSVILIVSNKSIEEHLLNTRPHNKLP